MKKTAFVLTSLIVLAAAVAIAQRGPQRPPDPRSMGGGDCRDNPYNCSDTPNPIAAPDTVWIEEMTWMDVRDALKAGKSTAIVATGGVEPNGPWLATGKHNYVLQANCDAIARKLGNALCAPIVKFVPEGNIEPKSGHMVSPGTITMREETFRAILTDIAESLQAHGFKNLVFIGDSGGNQNGQKAVAEALTAKWAGKALALHIPEYYDYAGVTKYMTAHGIRQVEPGDRLHDDAVISLNMFITDPNSIRFDQRVKAGKATINGVSLADRARNAELARQIVEYRAATTVEAIRKAIAAGGRTSSQ
jgi:creatinine amidohydrolase/Fe(II)-dependent formamide hydrolase-like protein